MKYVFALLICLTTGYVGNCHEVDPVKISDDEINKILKAKEIVRAMVRNPDTLVFHEFKTKVSGNVVSLTFTCKNDFGVPETHTKEISVK
jgi:hypothetical protein